MLMLEDGFTRLSGDLLERWLTRATGSLPRAMTFGFLSTSVMQSSTLVSIITISFLSAGLIPLAAGLGVILGANVGTTTGAWLIAGFGLKIDIAALALPLLAVSIVLALQRRRTIRATGYILAGIGFVFLGIHHIKEGFDAFSAQIDLTRFALTGALGLAVFTLLGAVLTAILQSSHATMVLVITALAAGQLTFDNALALAVGANIGTTVTAVVGGLTANYQGRRLALSHVVFNAGTGIVILLLIVPLRALVGVVSDQLGIGAEDYALRLAVFHTMFNVLGVLLILPLNGRLLRFLERRIPATEPEVSQPHFLSESVAAYPATMRAAVAREVEHLYVNATELIVHGLGLHRHLLYTADDVESYVVGSREQLDLDFDATYEQRVKVLYAAILHFVTHHSSRDPSDETAARLGQLRESAEHVVRAVKEVKHMRSNTSRYTAAPHGAATTLYNSLRIGLARVLVDLDELANEPPEDRSVLWLEDERERVADDKRAARQRVETLLRRGTVDAHVASSFLNDANYAFRAMGELLEGARLLYAEPEAGMAEVERLLAMEEDVLDTSDT
jgi:phosphate:Na+ symporter